MKTFIAILVLSGANIAAASEKILTKAAVAVHDLRCVIPGNDTPAYTLLGDSSLTSHIAIFHTDKVKLNHRVATKVGCDIPKIKKIVDQSRMSYGFIYQVPVQVITTLSEPKNNTTQGCSRILSEEIKIDLGDGLILESSAQQAQEC